MVPVRIMIVDDDPAILRVMARTLADPKYEVETFGGATEALKRLQDTEFDLLITDMIMPGMDGSQFIEIARAINAGMKVIALSGGGPTVPAALPLCAGRVVGADIALQKPVRRERLIAVIDALVGH